MAGSCIKICEYIKSQLETDDQYKALRADFLREFANMNRDGSVE